MDFYDRRSRPKKQYTRNHCSLDALASNVFASLLKTLFWPVPRPPPIGFLALLSPCISMPCAWVGLHWRHSIHTCHARWPLWFLSEALFSFESHSPSLNRHVCLFVPFQPAHTKPQLSTRSTSFSLAIHDLSNRIYTGSRKKNALLFIAFLPLSFHPDAGAQPPSPRFACSDASHAC